MTEFNFLTFLAESAESVPGALIGAFAGAGFAMWFAARESRRAAKSVTTQRLIDDLMSPQFLPHRIALGKLLDEFKADEDGQLLDRFARGFWFPGRSDEYAGSEPYDGLTLHEHFEASLGWVKRVAQAKRSSLLNEAEFAYVLKDAFGWMDAVLFDVANEVERQTAEHKALGEKPTAYTWVNDLSDVRTIFRSHGD